MKLTALFAALTVSLVVPAVGHAESAKAAKPAAAAEKPETELEKTMSAMGKAWRQVRKAAKDGQLSPVLGHVVATIRTNAEAAAKLTPALEADKPAAEQPKFHAAYQAQIKKLIGTLAKLQAALESGDNATAGKLIGEVNDVMKSGHQDFRKPDED